jgi:quercetin dioxygenase-like cupin family protein
MAEGTGTAQKLVHKSLESPDETRRFDNGRLDIANVGGATVGRFTLQPGWRWSEAVKPLAGTDWCEQTHIGYLVSGRLRTKLRDGSEVEAGAGDAVFTPPGHDAWVVGNETVVLLDVKGVETYAKK